MSKTLDYPHKPVMVNEVIRFLVTVSEGVYVDATVGSGGHSEAIGKEISSKGRLICLDRDPEAVRLSRERLSHLGERVTLINANYAELSEILEGLGIEKVNGILLDLGFSSYQIEQSGRGFSFNRDEPLDMRMDPGDEVTAQQMINNLSANEIKRILRDYGEEKRAGIISRSIERERKKGPITSSLQLAELVRSVIPSSYRPGVIDPATRTFQALRIAVNRETENIKIFLDKVPPLFAKGGRLVFLSYHSLEDRMVKQKMAGWEKGCTCPPDFPECACGKTPLFKRVNRKGIRPDKGETKDNPRARSAMLRASERI
ncbi:MAG: 16S rRNA (cytosine(1402)-N(4))-methyltransferase RsmH [Deltaproteobacteria bacterium]|nr:16S rRNA (cytosine(1402)-N(4))-methyltransferase RsmH [Deltaproteobacteria bacterium]